MKNIAIILSILGALSLTVAGQKIQIGIKKRAENCEIKTQKGDLVHIHYTVSDLKNPSEHFRNEIFNFTT